MTSIIQTFPGLKRVAAPIKFFSEAQAIELGRHGRSSMKSCLFFTTQKTASSFIPKAFAAVNTGKGQVAPRKIYDYATYLLHTRHENVYDYMRRRADQIFHPTGGVYAPLREMIAVPDIERYSIIVMLRDPRDVMVSNYFSLVNSHPLPGSPTHRAEMIARRNKARDQSLDEYVWENRDRYIKRYADFQTHLIGKPNVSFLTYEDMVLDFPKWAKGFLTGAGLEPTKDCLEALAQARGIDPGQSDTAHVASGATMHQHRRNGTPGEAQLRLKRETLAGLNEHFKPVLDAYGVWRQEPVQDG